MSFTHNTIGAVRLHLQQNLKPVYGEREAANLAAELLRHELDLSPAMLVVNGDQRLHEGAMVRLHQRMIKLKDGVPLQYVLGEAWFADLRIEVNEHVLIPRPETEELVTECIVRMPVLGCRVLDLGTGSGCIALAIKCLSPGSWVAGCDVSPVALELARRNAQRLRLDVKWFEIDILKEIERLPACDVIVSNPPYISLSEKSALPLNVAAFEPPLALFVPDEDPLLFYRHIAAYCKEHRHVYMVALECHENYTHEVSGLYGFMNRVEVVNDMQGKPRMVFASRY